MPSWGALGIVRWVQTAPNIFYAISPHGTGTTAQVYKSVNGGLVWEFVTTVKAVNNTQVSVWYDQWTPGDTGTRIHIAYMEATSDDVFYRYFDTASDTLGSEVTVFAGATFTIGATSTISITKAVGGNIYVAFDGDGGTEKGFYRSTDNGGSFGSRSDMTEGADYWILQPGNYADTQDIDCIFWDRSADEISLKTYDDSADSWSEASIATTMVDITTSSAEPQFSAVTRKSDGHIILAAWNNRDTATADLQMWDIDGSGSITALTDVVTNSDDCQVACLYIDQLTDYLYVFYLGKSDGSETTGTRQSFAYKRSTDGGSSWESEVIALASAASGWNFSILTGVRSGSGEPKVFASYEPTFGVHVLFVNNVPTVQPTYAAGVI